MATRDEMDQAAVEAGQDLKNRLERLGTEQAEGAYTVMNWFGKWYGRAGYKRLGRFIINEVLPHFSAEGG